MDRSTWCVQVRANQASHRHATYADGAVGVVGGGGVEERAEVQVQEGEPVLRLHPPACVGGKRSDWRIG